jgi:metal-responsive CopG/Arc/MetJ family transcriptional regulator
VKEKRKPGRPKSYTAQAKIVSISISSDILQSIDEIRGETSRSKWITEAIVSKLNA